MRGLVAAENFYRRGKNRKAGIFAVFLAVVAGLLTVFPGDLSNLRNTRSKSEIRAVLSNFNRSYRKEDIESLMALYADSPGVIAIGSGKFQQRIGREAIEAAYRKEFSTLGVITSVEHKMLSVTVSQEIASLAADIYITALRKDEEVQIAGRLTAVLKKVRGDWFFVQTHFSLNAPPE